MFTNIFQSYGLQPDDFTITPFGTGLINYTWRIKSTDKDFILQRINDGVFKQPGDIAKNIEYIAQYLQEHYPEYLFVAPVKTVDGREMLFIEGEGYFRMFPFVPHSHTISVVQSPQQAYEAAAQFGKFTRLLSGLDSAQLKIPIPDFHNLSLRYRQFEQSLQHGNAERIKETETSIKSIKTYSPIVDEFEKIKQSPEFKLRVTHHDTKISNVLFDGNHKGLCVIDLDTIMPGYFISDVGDMLRTYLSAVSEEEKEFSGLEIRDEFFKAIVDGYISEMKNELSSEEKKYFVYSGKFMIYMQAIRFLTDYLNNDSYYQTKYPGHNLVRANNQLALLQELVRKEQLLNRMI